MNQSIRIANRLFDAAFSSPLEPLWRYRLRGRVLCLLYHRVGQLGQYPSLDSGGSPVTSPEDLRRDVSFWAHRGAAFGTFRDLRDGWFPGPTEVGIIVCFDDGLRSTYEIGLPILEQLGVRGTVFQISSIIGSNRLLWEHRLYQLLAEPRTASELTRRSAGLFDTAKIRDASLADRLRFDLDREALNTLLDELEGDSDNDQHKRLAAALYPDSETILLAADRGHEVGSHGHEHQPRHRLNNQEFREDLHKSREALGRILGEAPKAYSHPFGDHLPGDADTLGVYFRQAAIVAPRPIQRSDSPLELPRCSWPGPAKNRLRWKRWLLTGHI